MVASKDMGPLPDNFVPVFIRNQFCVNIELPTRTTFPGLDGKTAIVTGANSGLGLEAARQLLTLGLSRLILAVRSPEKGEAAAGKLRQVNAEATIDVWELDMASYDSIRAFVRRCETELPRLDIVILNAGIGLPGFGVAPATGHERNVQVNHLGTALLAVLLLPVLKARSSAEQPARLTVVNSIMAHLAKFDKRHERPLLAALDDAEKWEGQDRYGSSKLLSQLFLVELAQRVTPDKSHVVINMVDPGLTRGTQLFNVGGALLNLVVRGIMRLVARPVERGAATYVHAVSRLGRESHGCFLMNAEIAPLAAIYYGPDGKPLTDQVWKETLDELKFAGVEDIIASF